jgi:adenosylcobinamide amidohydrolase
VNGCPLSGIKVHLGPDAVVVVAEVPLRVASTAVVNGGLTSARSIVNLHVSKDDPCADPAGMIATYGARAGLPPPWVGLLTAASTAEARTGFAATATSRALAVVTTGLSNPCTAGQPQFPPARALAHPGTINIVVVVDGDPSPAALLNAMTTITEAKTVVLFQAGVRSGAVPATGTSTDAIVVGATGRGVHHEYGGPATDLGWSVARAARAALEPAVARWQAAHG